MMGDREESRVRRAPRKSSAAVSGPDAAEPVLKVGDIQGNVLAGFNKDHQMLLLLAIDDAARAKRWLGDICGHLATTAQVLGYNRLRKAVKLQRGGASSGLTATWVNIAFSYSGLSKLTSTEEMV